MFHSSNLVLMAKNSDPVPISLGIDHLSLDPHSFSPEISPVRSNPFAAKPMKFGRQLISRKYPKWDTNYLEYDRLKHILKKISRSTEENRLKEEFIQSCFEELAKIDQFYIAQEDQVSLQFDQIKRSNVSFLGLLV